MSVTYTVTDSKGAVHTRTSRRHNRQEYTHACVAKPGTVAKHLVNYAGTFQGAASAHRQNLRCGYPDSEIREVMAVVK